MKRLIVLTLVSGLLGMAFVAKPVVAEETCVTVQQYGNAVSYICGAKTHEPVETGLAENLALVGGLSVMASGVLQFIAKRNEKLAEIN